MVTFANHSFLIIYSIFLYGLGWRSKDVPLDCQKFPLDVEPPKTPRQLHPMDCQDIVIGKVRGDLSNIGKVGFHGV